MSNTGRHWYWAILLLGLVGTGLAVWALRPAGGPPAPPDQAKPEFPLPGFSESRYLNTDPDALYIGSEACAKCHKTQHTSYLLTAHSRALVDVDPAAEPPDASFDHPASGRSYRVYRKDGKLYHEEVLRTGTGQEIARVDLPVRYLVGSGHFTRSYLVDLDGFLHESPITWYASRKRWDLSPGYDNADHLSFQRPVHQSCLRCHAGRVEETDEHGRFLTFREKAIGCESCHGPGSKHRDFHLFHKLAAGSDDPTIVHPGRLSRALLESVCAACHLDGAAGVLVRGRSFGDIRPGRPLSDYQVNYQFDDGDKMSVVGHVEQLRQSACYQKSPGLTCVTCHDPHAREKPKDPVAFYRQKCLDCHDTKPCHLPAAERLRKSPADDCASCHMPQGNTEIPHIAFSHHRIGRHDKPPRKADAGRIPELIPFDENPHLTPLDRQRNLGLAYVQALQFSARAAEYAGPYQERALGILEAVYDAGLRDSEVVLALLELSRTRGDNPRAVDYAREVLGLKGLDPTLRGNALLFVAKSELLASDTGAAVGLLEEATRLRRRYEDWTLLGGCYLGQNQPGKALAAFQQAVAINPFQHVSHASLAECYRRIGDLPRAKEHDDKARWLFDRRK